MLLKKRHLSERHAPERRIRSPGYFLFAGLVKIQVTALLTSRRLRFQAATTLSETP
jgi:hypothetical protein